MVNRGLGTSIIYLAFLLKAFSFFFIMPRLTRVIEPQVWGAVLSSQALANWLILVVDFSFALSLSRNIAISQQDSVTIKKVVSGVYSAKLLLIIPIFFITYFATSFGILQSHKMLAWCAFAWACAQGFSPLWYYQAIEKLYRFSLVEIFGRLSYIFLCLFFIRNTNDAYLVILFQAATFFAINLLTTFWLFKEVGGIEINFKGGILAIREGFILSSFSILTSIYTTASVFLFSIFASPVSVAFYGSADRLTRAAIGMLSPLNQILLPRSTKAFAKGYKYGFSFAGNILLIYSTIGILVFILGFFASPIIVKILLGKDYFLVIKYLRLLLILMPLTAINTVFVYHILIPNNLENVITKTYFFVSISAILLIIWLVPRFGAIGMINAMIIPEIIAMCILTYYSLRLYKAKLRV